METQTPHWRRLVLPFGFALLCLVLSFATYERFGGSLPLQPEPYRFEVPVPEAQNLPRGADVQMAGVVVGEVAGVRRTGSSAVVELAMEDEYAPVRSGARAAVRTKTLIGEGYVELAPGPPSAPLVPEGGRLDPSRARPSVQLDEFLESFDSATRERLQTLFAGMAGAYRGRARQLNETLAYAAPMTSDLAAVLEAVDQQRGDLQRLLSGAGEVLDAAGARPGALQAAIGETDRFLAITADRDRALAATVRALPGFVRQLHRTADGITAASGELERATGSLSDVTPRIEPTLRAITNASPVFERLFRQLRPTISSGRRGLPALRRILAALPSGFDHLYPATRELIPLMQLFARYAQPAVVASLSNSSSLTNGKLVGPGGKIISRAAGAVTVTNESIAGWIKRLPTNRSNAYPRPGGLRKVVTQGFLDSYDCRHTGNPEYLPPIGTGVPPCKVQGPWKFHGESAFYPRLRRSPP